MSNITMKEMLEAGVHFGHQTKRWDPRMKPYIFGARNGIYIIDLQKTVHLFNKAYEFVVDTVANGGSVLFVGTKKQANESIVDESSRCNQFYVVNRWLGGMLTNFSTLKKSIARYKYLQQITDDGTINRYHKKEILKIERERLKLEKNLIGVKDMNHLPKVLFVVDPKKEAIAVHEANKLKIPVVAVVDTNCNPSNIDYIIPANDDAIRGIRLLSTKIADAVLEGEELKAERLSAKEEDVSMEEMAEKIPAQDSASEYSEGEDGPRVVEI